MKNPVIEYRANTYSPTYRIMCEGTYVGEVRRCHALTSLWIGEKPNGDQAVSGAASRKRAARALCALAGLL